MVPCRCLHGLRGEKIMKLLSATLLSVLLPVLLSGTSFQCRKTSTAPDSPTQYYLYTASDSTGAAVVGGTIAIDWADASSLVGSWNLKMTGISQNVGPQVGNGSLHGMVAGEEIAIALNPFEMDNNVTLTGTFSDVARLNISGRWAWTTTSGLTAEGTFTLIRR